MISISADSGELETIKKKIKNQREISVQSQGEYSFDNLVFKELRNKGYMKKSDDYIRSKEDEKLSLTK